ncbi:MAG TPA: tRNA (N6-isopentenyl adenosine(37)-C2)-methylthiotransferase MiaB [Spirochaeta sp.]|nr:tRNA (N6-isopentenyl adenosine(37)-C2)-methylthiotransferase MiaB [Spirochaeta sp.]
MNHNFYIETYGCQMNTAESSAVRGDLLSKGWSESETAEDAGLIIINTCSVRKTAEDRIWGRLGFYKKLKKNNDFKLIVIGCMAERLKDDIKSAFPAVDEVVSNFKKVEISSLIDTDISSIAAGKDGIDETYTFFENHGKLTESHSMIPIMNGCDNFCSYCIVPYVRGHEISRDNIEIMGEINSLTEKGVSEITLLGQNVNSYLFEKHDFSDLLKDILNETDIKWLRFTSSNPQDFTDKLIKLIDDSKRICSFIHLPVQHGSDAVLQRMNRKYTADEYKNLVRKLKNLSRPISLSSDLMVGFPGETDADFEALISLMNNVRFEEAFTYYYNPREGTKAYDYKDDVPHEVKLERLTRVIELQRRTSFEEKSKRIGSVEEAVIENVSKKDSNEILARTEKNSMVVYPGQITKMNEYVNIKLKDLRGNTFIGEAVCSN